MRFPWMLLLLVPAAFALEQNSREMVMDVVISSDIGIVPRAASGVIEDLEAAVSFLPLEDDRQGVSSLTASPDAVREGDILKFSWSQPSGTVSFRISAQVTRKNDPVKIRERVPFPLEGIPQEYLVYSKPSPNIDADDPDIIALASQLASGEDDAYAAVSRIAAWTEQNIEYSLNTLTAEASQPASWVLQQRHGVCDELTSLFIALVRAVGIPARYVSGLAYTNWEGKDGWGPHAWAEVYFPGYGWVEYDITYGQYGYVDATHIKLRESADSKEPSTAYRWKARNADIRTNKLEFQVAAQQAGGRTEDLVTLSAAPYAAAVGFGSAALIEASVQNTKDYYIAESFDISNTQGLGVDHNRRFLFLAPGEEKKAWWIVQVADDLDPSYQYTFPIIIFSSRNQTASTSISVSRGEPGFSAATMQKIIDEAEEEQVKAYSKSVSLECAVQKAEFYDDEQNMVSCLLRNKGNIFLEGMELCFESCQAVDLGISQEKRMNLTIADRAPGKKERRLTVRHAELFKASDVQYTVNDPPKISIAEVSVPAAVRYKDSYELSFLLSKESFSNPRNVKIPLRQGSSVKRWASPELLDSEQIVIQGRAKDLRAGTNRILIEAAYQDKNGRMYAAEGEATMDLVDVTPWQRVKLFFNAVLGDITGAVV